MGGERAGVRGDWPFFARFALEAQAGQHRSVRRPIACILRRRAHGLIPREVFRPRNGRTRRTNRAECVVEVEVEGLQPVAGVLRRREGLEGLEVRQRDARYS